MQSQYTSRNVRYRSTDQCQAHTHCVSGSAHRFILGSRFLVKRGFSSKHLLALSFCAGAGPVPTIVARLTGPVSVGVAAPAPATEVVLEAVPVEFADAEPGSTIVVFVELDVKVELLPALLLSLLFLSLPPRPLPFPFPLSPDPPSMMIMTSEEVPAAPVELVPALTAVALVEPLSAADVELVTV